MGLLKPAQAEAEFLPALDIQEHRDLQTGWHGTWKGAIRSMLEWRTTPLPKWAMLPQSIQGQSTVPANPKNES